MIIDEIKNKEYSTRVQKAIQQPQQGQWTNWDTAIQRSVTWNDIKHMVPLRISSLIKSVYDLLSSNANLVLWGKKDDPTFHCAKEGQHRISTLVLEISPSIFTESPIRDTGPKLAIVWTSETSRSVSDAPWIHMRCVPEHFNKKFPPTFKREALFFFNLS
ncbi:reverse transcriptase [Plakobranchus ocellatus]|uniref:Reverse transcriptase n=1 Tax=Plakobranchus ocellatus TaxID=259542 RepID=A0AAV4CB44_9GAST|nr:reverse transcriptase [Plakobranchus ocellatus]